MVCGGMSLGGRGKSHSSVPKSGAAELDEGRYSITGKLDVRGVDLPKTGERKELPEVTGGTGDERDEEVAA